MQILYKNRIFFLSLIVGYLIKKNPKLNSSMNGYFLFIFSRDISFNGKEHGHRKLETEIK